MYVVWLSKERNKKFKKNYDRMREYLFECFKVQNANSFYS